MSMANNKNMWVGSLGACCVAIAVCIVYQVRVPSDANPDVSKLAAYSSSPQVKKGGLVRQAGEQPEAKRSDSRLVPGNSMESMVETAKAVLAVPPREGAAKPEMVLKTRYAKSPDEELEYSEYIQRARLVDFREHRDRKLKDTVSDPVLHFSAEEECRRRFAKELRPRERCGYRINAVVSKGHKGHEIVYAEVDPKASKRMSSSCRNFAQCMAKVALGREVQTEKPGRSAVSLNGAISRDYDRNCNPLQLDQMISVFETDIQDQLKHGVPKGQSARDMEFWISQEKKTAEYYRMLKRNCES